MALTKSLAATDEEIARDLLVKNDWELTPVEALVDLLGFTEVEKRMQKLFWDPAFRSAHLYLSDELILNHLTDETGKHAVGNFITRTLTEHFVEGTDYTEVNKDHALVQAYFGSSLMKTQKPKRLANGKRFFIITSKCFKGMLMLSRSTKSILTRGYYIKIEDAARIMSLQISLRRERMFEIESKNNEAKMLESAAHEARAIEEKTQADAPMQRVIEEKAKVEAIAKETLEYKERIIQTMLSFPRNAKPTGKKGYIYIAASNTLAKENQFKVGVTTTMRRTTNFNTPISGVNHKFHYVFYRECADIWVTEKTFKTHMANYKVPDANEVYDARFDYIKNAAIAAADGQNAIVAVVNELTSYAQKNPVEYYEGLIVPPAIPLPAAYDKRIKPVAPIALDRMEHNALAKKLAPLVEDYMAVFHDVHDFKCADPKAEAKSDVETKVETKSEAAPKAKTIKFSWKRFVTFLRDKDQKFNTVTKIKSAVAELISGLNSIECQWREPIVKK